MPRTLSSYLEAVGLSCETATAAWTEGVRERGVGIASRLSARRGKSFVAREPPESTTRFFLTPSIYRRSRRLDGCRLIVTPLRSRGKSYFCARLITASVHRPFIFSTDGNCTRMGHSRSAIFPAHRKSPCRERKRERGYRFLPILRLRPSISGVPATRESEPRCIVRDRKSSRIIE